MLFNLGLVRQGVASCSHSNVFSVSFNCCVNIESYISTPASNSFKYTTPQVTDSNSSPSLMLIYLSQEVSLSEARGKVLLIYLPCYTIEQVYLQCSVC